MKTLVSLSISVLAFLLTPLAAAQATNDSETLQLATCKQSWLDFKNDPAKSERFVASLKSNFKANGRDGSFVPLKPMTVLGHDVFQLYPESVGMAVGYSIIVNAGFDAVKSSLEKLMGKPFESCQSASEGKSCERQIGEKKTVMLMEGSRGNNPKTLFGCYYFYAK